MCWKFSPAAQTKMLQQKPLSRELVQDTSFAKIELSWFIPEYIDVHMSHIYTNVEAVLMEGEKGCNEIKDKNNCSD